MKSLSAKARERAIVRYKARALVQVALADQAMFTSRVILNSMQIRKVKR